MSMRKNIWQKTFTILFGLFLTIVITSGLYSVEETGPIRRVAMFVGSNNGGLDRVLLEYADSDASNFAAVMEQMGGILFDDRIILSNPGIEDLNAGFNEIGLKIDDSKADARQLEFLFYYSGHSDEEGLLIGEERYSYKDLRDSIKETGADVNIAILDSCSSGAFTRLKGGVRRSPFLLDESVKTQGHAFLTSSSEDEAAQESDRIGGSFFTHYLISGLRGAADNSLDGKVTLNEVYSYASRETLARTENTQAGPQHPAYNINLTGAGDLVLTDLRVISSGIVFDEQLQGRMFIRDNRGDLVAELKKSPGLEMMISLPSGRYSVAIEYQDDIFETQAMLTNGKKESLTQQDFSRINKEETRSRGDSDEFDFASDIVDEVVKFTDEIGEIIEKELSQVFDTLEIEQDHPNYDNSKIGEEFIFHFIGDNNKIDGVEIGLLNMVTTTVRGVQYGYVGNLVGETVFGTQMANVFNINGGSVTGAQGAGVFNLNDGESRWFQGAGVFNINVGSTTGFQGAGVFNINEGNVRGFQGGGVFNLNNGSVNGFQGAGVFNLNASDLTGFQGAGVFNMNAGFVDGYQGAGIFNSADRVNGTQMSLVNISGDVKGTQFGLVNIGGNVRGTQIGLININNDIKGFPIGLFNISKTGLNHLFGWSDERGLTYAGMQIGTRTIYSIAYGGTEYNDPGKLLIAGYGMGFHLSRESIYIEGDLSAKYYATGLDFESSFNNLFIKASAESMFPSVRGLIGLEISSSLALIAGVTLEGHVPGITIKNDLFHSGDPHTLQHTDIPYALELYPRWFVGIRI
jgi:hypothetical protein